MWTSLLPCGAALRLAGFRRRRGSGLRWFLAWRPWSFAFVLGYCLSPPSPSSKKHPWVELQAARAVRPSMQIAARRGDVVVAERRLHLRQRGTVVDGMRTMGVAQPMG